MSVVEQAAATVSPMRRRSSRLPIAAVMIALLLGSAGTRYWADQNRAGAIPQQGGDSTRQRITGRHEQLRTGPFARWSARSAGDDPVDPKRKRQKR